MQIKVYSFFFHLNILCLQIINKIKKKSEVFHLNIFQSNDLHTFPYYILYLYGKCELENSKRVATGVYHMRVCLLRRICSLPNIQSCGTRAVGNSQTRKRNRMLRSTTGSFLHSHGQKSLT